MSHTNRFREKLEKTDDFIITAELVPDINSCSRKAERVVQFAKDAAADGVLDGVTLCDNPGGSPSLSPDRLGGQLLEEGIDPIIHMACRDSTRFGLYSRAAQLDAMGVQNILALTGDGPAISEVGKAKPCFDIDSVNLLNMLQGMNEKGSTFAPPPKDPSTRHLTDFFVGAAVSCQKSSESEQMNQYYKLVRKVRSGAKFIITQLAYDARKFEELMLFMKSQNIDVPVLASVYKLSKPAARFMRTPNVPGVYISDDLYETVTKEAESEDKGKAASIERSAKLMAVLKGLGYRGAHLAGYYTYDDIKSTIESFEKIKDNWKDYLKEFDYPYKEGFYVYKKDPETGMNSETYSEREKGSLAKACSMTSYDAFHEVVFSQDSAVYPLLKKIADFIQKYKPLRSGVFFSERLSKKLLFRCKSCGDCALGDVAYYCPEAICPKYTRNGPCGGSEEMQCEIRPEQYCVWVSAYKRLASVKKTERLKDHYIVPPRNWALDQSSAWLNFYQGIDHNAIMSQKAKESEEKDKASAKSE